jgi:hypothetical protein
VDRWHRQPLGPSEEVIARMYAEVEGARGQREELPHDAFVAYCKELMDADRDPELHEAIWDFREGKTTRSMLEEDPVFRRAMAAHFVADLDALGEERLEDIRAEAAAYRESEQERREQQDRAATRS